MSGGDPLKAAYSAGCSISASATTSGYNASGNGFADVALLGSGYMRIANADASISGSKTGRNIYANLKFAGSTIYSYGQPAESMSSTYFTRTYKPAIAPTFIVGPVTVTVRPSMTVGLSLSAKASYSTATQAVTTTIKPSTFDCAGGVTASVALGIISVNGSLTLCRIDPTVTGSCDFKNRRASTNGSINYSTLGGSLGLKLGYGSLSYSRDLVSWSGYSSTQNVFSETLYF